MHIADVCRLAKHLGLVIYVTVGTEDKRKLIMEEYGIPEEHIFHSRDASFVKVRIPPAPHSLIPTEC